MLAGERDTDRPARHARLFRNGRNQALRIPREFELEADEVIIYREDDRLVVEPVPRAPTLANATRTDRPATRGSSETRPSCHD